MIATPKRRWYQFSLSRLLVLTTVAGFALGYVGYERRLADQQHQAEIALQKLGISLAGGRENSTRPDWLKRLFGDDSAGRSSWILVGPGPATGSVVALDDAVARLKQFKNASCLVINDKQFGNEELAHFRELTQIRCVILQETKVTDRGLQQLREMKSLTHLNLIATPMTDEGLTEVARHRNLEALWLWGTHVTDAGLQELRPLKSLKLLDISNTKVTDDGLLHLADMTKLEDLNLTNTEVTDAGVQRLQKTLPKLRIEH